jgi:hypothetical protein
MVLYSFLGHRHLGRVVSNSLKRARKYRSLAEECLRLSLLAPSAETKAEYRLLAGQYVTLAEGEESRAVNRRQPTNAGVRYSSAIGLKDDVPPSSS